MLAELCAGVQARAAACRASVRDTVDLNDTSGVELPVHGTAPRPMVVIKAEKLDRARFAHASEGFDFESHPVYQLAKAEHNCRWKYYCLK